MRISNDITVHYFSVSQKTASVAIMALKKLFEPQRRFRMAVRTERFKYINPETLVFMFKVVTLWPL